MQLQVGVLKTLLKYVDKSSLLYICVLQFRLVDVCLILECESSVNKAYGGQNWSKFKSIA